MAASNWNTAFGMLLAAGLAPADARVFLESPPADRSAAGVYAPRNLALGEPRFTDPKLFNLYDQGGSPIGLLETHSERVGATLGFSSSGRTTPGDSLRIDRGDYVLPGVGLFQPGIFAATLYFQRETESYGRQRGDSIETGKARFGLDLAAGPASGLVRIGFGAHAALGATEYPGNPKRVIIEAPSLRLDVASRLLPVLELGAYGGVGVHFDSLKNASNNQLERVASMTLPRYGFMADIGGAKEIPVRGNVLLEFGTNRFFGEYRAAASPGQAYTTLWTDYWDFQTQWMVHHAIGDFRLGPALRFAKRSEEAQGYAGIISNQNPLRKGAKIPGLTWNHGITDFGFGGNFGYREIVSLLLEWETSGHDFDTGSSVEKRYNRFSLGLEHNVQQWPVLRFPRGLTLALRAGWLWRQEEKGAPGYRAFQFDPFLPSVTVPTRLGATFPIPGDPAGYSALQMGFGLGLLDERLNLDGLLSFPGQLERMTANRYQEASGLEFGLTARYRIF